jgi:integrase
LVFGEPKSARSRRTVLLRGPVLEAVREHRKKQLAERLRLGWRWSDEDLVFCTTTGGRLDPGNVYESFHRQLKRAGLPKRRVHDLRHSAAIVALQVGVGLKEVSDMLGHSTISLTANTYCHVTPAMRDEAAERIAALFSSPKYGSGTR